MKSHKLKIKYKIIIILTSIILLINLLFISFRFSNLFQNLIITNALKILNNSLNGSLDYEKFTGNLFNNFIFHNITIADSTNHTVISVNKIAVEWDYKKIFRQHLEIKQLKIDTVQVKLVKHTHDNQTILNLSNIFPTNKNNKQNNQKDSQTRLPFKIVIDSISTNNISICYNDLMNNKYLTINTIQSSLLYDNILETTIYINDVAFINPDLYIEQLSTALKVENEIVSINHFDVFTTSSIISIEGYANFENLHEGNITLILNPMNFDDFSDIFSLPSSDEPLNIKANFILNPDKINSTLSIIHKESNIRLNSIVYHKGNIKDFNPTIIDRYQADIDLQNFQPLQYIANNSHFLLSGNIKLKGSGTALDILNLDTQININNLEFNELKIDSLAIFSNIKDVSLNSDIHLTILDNKKDIASKLNADIQINDYLNRQEYFMKFATKNFNIGHLFKDFSSDLNLNADIQGQGFNLNELSADAKIEILDSIVYNQDINKLLLELTYLNNILTIDKLDLLNKDFFLNHTSKLTKNELLKSETKININEFQSVADILDITANIENLDFKAFLYLNAQGKWDSLSGYSLLKINDFIYNNISIENIENYIHLNNLKTMDMYSNLEINNISENSGNIVFSDKVNFKIFLANNNGNLILEANKSLPDKSSSISDNYKLILDSNFYINNDFSLLKADIQHISITHPEVVWENKYSPTITIQPHNISLNNFNLFADEQSIIIHNLIKQNNLVNLDLNIISLNIENFLRLIDVKQDLNGKANIKTKISLKNNHLSELSENIFSYLDLEITDFNYNNITLGDIDLNTKINNHTKSTIINLNLINNQEKPAFITKLKAELPLTDTNLNKINIANDRDLSVNLSLNNINLERFQGVIPQPNQLKAMLDFNLNLTGTLKSPQTSGNLYLNSGSFTNHQLGLNFNNINSEIEIKNNQVNINNFSLTGNRGTFITKGFFKTNINDNEISLKNTDIVMTMNRLELLNSKLLKATLSSNISIKDNDQNELYIIGNITSQEIRIFLDEILKMNNLRTVPEPLLVKTFQSLQNTSDTPSETINNENDSKKTKKNTFLMPAILSSIRVILPRNVWILGDDINLELRGDILVTVNTKNTQIIELDGSIEINRGYYQFLGKRFYFEEGKASFIGSELDNPELNIKANYHFRNPYGIKQTISLLLSGTAKNPVISFTLDNNQIDEKEAISLIVFGRGSEYLTQSEDQAVTQNTSELQTATALLAGQLSGQLSQLLQRQLNLDMIEISGDNQWQQASLTVGRYFGNNLFVSYEKGFDFTDFKALKSDKINIEYQINKYLFLNTIQGANKENGIDLLFKIQSNK